ncbi:hypothetical protein QE410_002422 [Microbacterium sp. SORGH_AS 1204]|nr:hypothetical protein [Microbacterium sp. SORGH_AS_1204]
MASILSALRTSTSRPPRRYDTRTGRALRLARERRGF